MPPCKTITILLLKDQSHCLISLKSINFQKTQEELRDSFWYTKYLDCVDIQDQAAVLLQIRSYKKFIDESIRSLREV
jgi:hypothetical protein